MTRFILNLGFEGEGEGGGTERGHGKGERVSLNFQDYQLSPPVSHRLRVYESGFSSFFKKKKNVRGGAQK